MRPLMIRGGRVVDPSRDLDETADVLIEDQVVRAIGPRLGVPDGARTVEAPPTAVDRS